MVEYSPKMFFLSNAKKLFGAAIHWSVNARSVLNNCFVLCYFRVFGNPLRMTDGWKCTKENESRFPQSLSKPLLSHVAHPSSSEPGERDITYFTNPTTALHNIARLRMDNHLKVILWGSRLWRTTTLWLLYLTGPIHYTTENWHLLLSLAWLKCY